MKVTLSYHRIALLVLAALACSADPQLIGGAEPLGMAGAPAAGGTGPDSANEPSAPPDGIPYPDGTPTKPVKPGGSDMPSASEPDGGTALAPDSNTELIAPRGPCGIEQRVGRFSIERQASFGVVQGSLSEGVVPTSIPRLALEAGACRLLERRNLSCLPACVGAETCGESGTCIPYPRQLSAGEVVITGLTKETRMSPLQPGNTYFAPGADNPPFTVQSPIVLSAAGDGSVTPFQLFAVGSEPLAEAPAWVLEAGADLAITWAAPTADAGTGVLVELTIDQHGISPLSLSCEFDDTGSATVPAGIIDELIGAGVTGFPNGRITRRTADHVDLTQGCVELVVGSPLAAAIAVVGFTPCNASADCPEGQACNLPLQRCE
jgi:hypothetical protein